ncbi:MAG: ABC transporter permease [Leptospiraceae bacterium]|nr:ABC transporter permease [Leptospiraceae bacterium]
MGAQSIAWEHLAIGYLMLVIPVYYLFRHKTGLVGSALVSILRMTVQLILIGTYLKYLFDYDRAWINIGWVVVMAGVATASTIRRTEVSRRWFVLPVFAGMLAGTLVTDWIFLRWVIDLQDPFGARYLIPISGMILGNNLSGSIIGLRTYTGGIQDHLVRYRHYLACGALPGEARSPFIREALKSTFQPTIATMATLGLVKLPGMMTGQILGGSAPIEAVQYQIMIMVSIFTSSMITLMITLLLANRFLFDSMANPILERMNPAYNAATEGS